MGSIFGDAFAGLGQAESDQEEEERQRNLDPFKAPVLGPLPPAPVGGINPTQGGFRGPENPPNLQPGPNADYGIFDLGQAASAITPNYIEQTPPPNLFDVGAGISALTPNYIEQAPTPSPLEMYQQDVPLGISDFVREQVQPRTGAVGEFLFSGPNAFGLGMPNPGAQDIGRFLGESIPPVSAGDFALGAGLSKGPVEMLTGLPIDDLARGAYRFAMPEPSLFPGLGAGVPPPPIDPFSASAWVPPTAGGQIPHVGDPAEYLGSFDPGLEASLRGVESPGLARASEPLARADAGAPLDPGLAQELDLAQRIADDDAAMARGLWNPTDYPSYPNADNLPDGSPGTRLGAPLAYDPRLAPNADELTGGGARPASAAGDVTGAGPGNVTLPPPASLPDTAGVRSDEALARMGSKPEPEPGVIDRMRAGVGENPLPENVPGRDAFAQARDNALMGKGEPPEVTPAIARDTARAIGVPEAIADRVQQTWARDNRVLYDVYASPQGLARVQAFAEGLARPIEGAVTGNNSDSFINAVLTRKTELENMLGRTGASADEVAKRVDAGVSDMITAHYPKNPEKATQTHAALVAHEERAKELAESFKILNSLNDVWKNTVAGVGDAAYFGQTLLAGAMQMGPQTVIGAANRIAAAMHFPLALDVEKLTGLPQRIAKENMGVRYGPAVFAENPKAGTIFGIAPKINPIAPIDKYVFAPGIEKLGDLQYKYVGGFLKDSAMDGALLQHYVYSFAKGMLDNGGNLTRARDFAAQQIARPDVQRNIGRFINNAWSSSPTALTPGRAQSEKLLSFSAGFTRAQAGRITDTAKLITPGASEAQRVLAAGSILSSVAFIAGAYKYLNDKFGTTDAELDPLQLSAKDGKPGFGRIILPGGQVVSLVPQQSIRNAMIRTEQALAKGNPEDVKSIWFQALVGREGLPAQLATRGAGYGYDTKGNFYSPFTNDGKTMPIDERLKASAPLPFAASPIVFNGQPVLSTETGLNVAGLNTFQESKSSEAFRERLDVTQLRSQSLIDRDLLRSAFPKQPEVADALFGREWSGLEWHEQQAIIKALPPDQAKQIQEADAASAAANKERPTAIGNKIEINQRTDQNINAVYDKTKADADGELTKLLFSGKYHPSDVRDVANALKDIQREKVAIEAWKGGTTYTGLPWPEKNADRPPQSAIEQAIEEWKSLGSMLPRTKDGKFDFDGYETAKDAYLRSLNAHDPVTANRLWFYAQTKEAEAEARKPELFKFYDQFNEKTQAYWDLPAGTKNEWRTNHPVEDAMLYMLGYMPNLRSQAAAEVLKGMAPNIKPIMAK